MFPRFSDVQSLIDPLLYLTGLGDVLGVLEGHCLEYDEPLRISSALPDSCEFRGKSLDKEAHNSSTWHVIPPLRHHRQGSPEFLTRLVILDPPTEVPSLVGVHPVFLYLPDLLVLPCGNIPWKITHGPLPVLRLVYFPPCPRCRRFYCVPLL